MKAGTVIELPDGRIGTICWHHLDGYGGVFGKIEITDSYPKPEFMLRNEDVKHLLADTHGTDIECVGEEYTIVKEE